MSNAMLCVRPEVRERACGLGEYPSSLATLSTRLRMSSLTRPGWVRARETVEVATPAAFATSEIVITDLGNSTRRLIPIPLRYLSAASSSLHAAPSPLGTALQATLRLGSWQPLAKGFC